MTKEVSGLFWMCSKCMLPESGLLMQLQNLRRIPMRALVMSNTITTALKLLSHSTLDRWTVFDNEQAYIPVSFGVNPLQGGHQWAEKYNPTTFPDWHQVELFNCPSLLWTSSPINPVIPDIVDSGVPRTWQAWNFFEWGRNQEEIDYKKPLECKCTFTVA